MGKPLKAKQLNLSKGQRDKVLKWQGVKMSKRIRLGHTGHFGKVDVVPIEGKPGKVENRSQEDSEPLPVVAPNLKGKLPGESYSKFLKRVGKETREALVQLQDNKRRVSAKRKAYLDGRKDMTKEKKLQIQRISIVQHAIKEENFRGKKRVKVEEDLPLDEAVKLSLAAIDSKQQVMFGEQAERPPQIKISKPFKGLRKQLGQNIGYVQGGLPVIPQVAGEERNRREFELLRQNAVQSYREMVQKRREKKGMASL
uniref:Uncharacterized protein n=1 Tax=Cryptomonas curvata TaxID=233186 RepID=A0A7S0MGF1_9CRYP|mmetsp:Transcript_38451/g.80629  ORF Transcript_38451/g.80629 Transcript_38451/m.80629 type:complete len:255 (+) Transcript_38451:2-766(+)